MLSTPLVSLAIPIYNVEKTVKNSLNSALQQTYNNIEYLIIDDKSTDQSMTVVEDLLSLHPRRNQIKIIDHVKNKGLGDTRNTAIDHASGNFIFFMDSDDLISPDCIERLVSYMQETPVDFVASSRVRKSFDGKLIAQDIYNPAIVDSQEQLAVARFRYVENHKILGEVWNKLYNLEFLRRNKIRCIPGVHVEDVSFSFQVILHATSCRLVPDITYTYHIYEGQSFAAFNNNKQRATYLADCFCRIRAYDVSLLSNIPFHKTEYGALLSGIYNVVLLHAGMIQRSSVLTLKDKLSTYGNLWKYPLPLKQVLGLKTKRKQNFAYYLFCHLPEIIQHLCLTFHNRNHG